MLCAPQNQARLALITPAAPAAVAPVVAPVALAVAEAPVEAPAVPAASVPAAPASVAFLLLRWALDGRRCVPIIC
jgi:hypothetical protein